MRVTSLWLIGCGGTGGLLAAPLHRLLRNHGVSKIHLVDGDVYTLSNAARQGGVDGMKKALLLYDTLTLQDEGAEAEVHDTFVTGESLLAKLTQAGEVGPLACPMIVTAVDNSATRASILEAADALPNAVVLMPGNDLETGTIIPYIRVACVAPIADPRLVYGNLANPTDRIPGGCGEQTPSTPQLISANMAAAMATLWYAQAILDGQPMPEAVTFDLRRWVFTPVGVMVQQGA